MRVVLGIGLLIGALLVALFGSAGRLDLPFFWAYVTVAVVVMIIAYLRMPQDLVQERLRPGEGGTDRHLRTIATPLYLAHLVIAGLDVGRFHWSDTVPLALQIAGLGGVVLALSLSMWAVTVNRFFSPVVRVQRERGHHVVTGGPYRFIRHPGYAATLLSIPSGAVALGSWWSMAPLAPVAILILRRARIEDRYLHEHLPGYAAYAGQVPFRLIPGVW